MDLREIEWEVVDWVHLAEDREYWRGFVNMVTKLRVPKNCGMSRLGE
jgi:hypothetical protein